MGTPFHKIQHRCILILILFMLTIHLHWAASLEGEVYDYTLTPLNNTVLTINSTPQQQIVTQYGKYTLDITPGTYTIEVFNYEQNLYTKQQITIIDERNYQLDFILTPNFEEDDILFEDLSFEEPLFEEDDNWQTITLISFSGAIVFFVLLAIVYIILRKKRKQLEQHTTKTQPPQPKQENKKKHIEEQIIDFLKTNNDKATQKEIRKHIAYSEAQISVSIKILEAQGRVKKIKIGKGNIVQLLPLK